MTACIVGWAHTKFGKLEGETVESLITRVANEALTHAGIGPDDVDEIVLGHFNAGFSPQDFTASLVLQADDRLRFKARHARRECLRHRFGRGAPGHPRSGSQGRQGRARRRRRADDGDTRPAGSGKPDPRLLHGRGSEHSGRLRRAVRQDRGAYFQRHGDQSDAIAKIAAKNHKNGMSNPLAHMQKDFGYEFCRTESDKNPYVAGPLKRTDCSLVSDGAAAIVADGRDDRTVDEARHRLPCQRACAGLPADVEARHPAVRGLREGLGAALKNAGVTLDDLSFVETHDCFTIAELIEYEAMGLAKRGEGAKVALEGQTEVGGRLPVNVSGGLKAKGHPIARRRLDARALGHAADRRGLRHPGSGRQARRIFNMGGAAVANYVSILERIK